MQPEASPAKQLLEQLAAEFPPDAPKSEKPDNSSSQPTKADELAIQDTTRRHEGLVQLIYHNDRKAVQLIGIYIAITGALATAIVANLKNIGLSLAVPAIAIMLLLLFGIVASFRAHWTAQIFLTGMKPDFWIWTRQHGVSATEFVDEYLRRTAESLDRNEETNDASSKQLRRAYISGIAATAAAILTVAVLVTASTLCREGWLGAWGANLCRPL